MNYYNSETLLEQQAEIEKLKEQNAALAATVEVLREQLKIAYDCLTCADETGYVEDCGFVDLESVASDIATTISNTPQQHLAEIRAEAVKNEFGSILHSVANQFTGDDTTNPWHNGANHVFVLFSKEIDKRFKSIRKGEVK